MKERWDEAKPYSNGEDLGGERANSVRMAMIMAMAGRGRGRKVERMKERIEIRRGEKVGKRARPQGRPAQVSAAKQQTVVEWGKQA